MSIFDLLFDPDGFFKEEIEFKKPLWRGATVVAITAVLTAIIEFITAPVVSHAVYEMLVKKGVGVEMAKIISSSLKLMVVIAPLTVFIEWVIISLILFGLSAIFGGSGSFRDTLRVTAYSFVPSIVVFPFEYYISLIKIKIVEVSGLLALRNSGIYKANLMLSLAVLAWQFMLWRYGIKHARNLDDKSAILVSGILAGALALISLYGMFKQV